MADVITSADLEANGQAEPSSSGEESFAPLVKVVAECGKPVVQVQYCCCLVFQQSPEWSSYQLVHKTESTAAG